MIALYVLLAAATINDGDRVLVLDVKAAGVDDAAARAATAAVVAALGSRAVTEQELTTIVDVEKARATLDCSHSDASCLAEVARWSAARFVLSSTLGQVGRATTLTLSLADAEAAAVIGRDAIVVDDVKMLAAAIGPAVARLLGAQKEARFTVSKGERASYAVFPVDVQIASMADVARSLTDVVAVEVKRVDGTTVVSIDDVAAMVSAEKDRSVLTCSNDASCLAEIGAALDVDRLVVSSVGKVADTFVVSARLLDVKRVKVLSRVSESFVGPDEQLLRAMRRSTRELLGVPAGPPGAVVVATPEVGARVYVDGEERGRTPTAPIAEVAAGRHALRVAQDGFLDWQGDIYVDSNETTAQWAVLTERETLLRPFLPEWAFYSLVGATSVALAGAGVAGGLTAWSQSEYTAKGQQSIDNTVDGESVLMPLWHRTEALANVTGVLLAVGAGAGVLTVASVPVVDFE